MAEYERNSDSDEEDFETEAIPNLKQNKKDEKSRQYARSKSQLARQKEMARQRKAAAEQKSEKAAYVNNFAGWSESAIAKHFMNLERESIRRMGWNIDLMSNVPEFFTQTYAELYCFLRDRNMLSFKSWISITDIHKTEDMITQLVRGELARVDKYVSHQAIHDRRKTPHGFRKESWVRRCPEMLWPLVEEYGDLEGLLRNIAACGKSYPLVEHDIVLLQTFCVATAGLNLNKFPLLAISRQLSHFMLIENLVFCAVAEEPAVSTDAVTIIRVVNTWFNANDPWIVLEEIEEEKSRVLSHFMCLEKRYNDIYAQVSEALAREIRPYCTPEEGVNGKSRTKDPRYKGERYYLTPQFFSGWNIAMSKICGDRFENSSKRRKAKVIRLESTGTHGYKASAMKLREKHIHVDDRKGKYVMVDNVFKIEPADIYQQCRSLMDRWGKKLMVGSKGWIELCGEVTQAEKSFRKEFKFYKSLKKSKHGMEEYMKIALEISEETGCADLWVCGHWLIQKGTINGAVRKIKSIMYNL
jgi:hypothetical protein